MSQYITKLREERDEQGQTGRDGINWPTPVGTWKQNENINRLETFANNLDVSQVPRELDLLNSVPTPWARLLLFESALYKVKHPAHQDVEDQWRGLLGVLALANPLRLNFKTKIVRLSDHPASRIGNSFAALRPHYMVGGVDEEAAKWNELQLITVDGVTLGATSPRTLVFSGITHQCPSSIPFRSPQGRLSDPGAYYKKFNDHYFLGLLARWISNLKSLLERDQRLAGWLGTVPAAPGAVPGNRVSLLMERLNIWQASLNGIQPTEVPGDAVPRFTLFPYSEVRGLPNVQESGLSDLFLKARKDVMVCYRPENGSKLLTAYDQDVVNEPIKIYDGRWVRADEPLPLPFNFLPNTITVIEDPATLFEDTLIQVSLPDNTQAVHYLQLGSKMYLFPFKPEVLKYFTTAMLKESTKLIPDSQSNKLRIELKIQLEGGRSILATRNYAVDTGVIADTSSSPLLTAELASWPDFTSPGWHRYYYFKTSFTQQRQVDFEPLVSNKADSRKKGNDTWYITTAPAEAFVGSVDGKQGLLLLNNTPVPSPDKFWKVGVDFGSTHTRAFSLLLEKRGSEYMTAQDVDIEPIGITTRAQQLTHCDQNVLRDKFFALVGYLSPSTKEELETLMMMPETNPHDADGWLPREGYVYMHWIINGDYDESGLRYNMKWNSHRDDPDLRAFLRCLLVMIEAEAVRKGAQIVSVSHTYPSVFTEALKAKHNAEWRDLEQYMNTGDAASPVPLKFEEATMSETIAVCRHLEWEQDASPTNNTISLDVGGSTTDMAVWAKKKLEVQESVKMASGLIGRYLQSTDAKDFLRWLEQTVRGGPYNMKTFALANFAKKPAGYSLMFNNVLSHLEWKGYLNELIKQINGANESRKMLSHIIYLYGSLLYYAGLLARKAGLPKQGQQDYQLFFCGKGGTLIKWIRGYEALTEQMFEAGLNGPPDEAEKGAVEEGNGDASRASAGTGGGSDDALRVKVKVSEMPKEEVGRGLLAESQLQGNPRDSGEGLLDPTPPTVTVGETGWKGLEWDAPLTPAALLSLPDNEVPKMNELKELNAFLDAFKQKGATRAAAVELNLDTINVRDFQTGLLQRLFGSARGSIIADIKGHEGNALLEPLFITEVKVLLETATQNTDLFN